MTTTTAPAVEPALLTAVQAAALMGISARHLYRLCDAGRAPRPLRLGAAIRWERSRLLDWIGQGCPDCREGAGRE